jgi:hypothetical protein
MGTQPNRLRRGTAFHRLVQEDWLRSAKGGKVQVEKGCTKPSGRRGRMDVFVAVEGDDLVAIAEVKATDWDRISVENIKRNVRRQCRQLWSYIDPYLADGKDVSPGIIFPRRPTADGQAELIESLFEEEGIPVVWKDELTMGDGD